MSVQRPELRESAGTAGREADAARQARCYPRIVFARVLTGSMLRPYEILLTPYIG
jgi:hypothetical protein